MKMNKKIVLIITISILIELIIILYNHFNDYYEINSLLEFIVRLSFGSFMVSILLAILYFVNLKLIKELNKKFSWNARAMIRVINELLLSLVISMLSSVLLTGTSNLFFPYEDGLIKNINNNFLIISVSNIIFLTVLEGYFYFIEWNKLKFESEKLEKENAIAKYNTLKSQLNPHFLFNSLSVLSNIVEVYPEKSEEYIEKLSSIYRYITDSIDKQIVILEKEINFAFDYLELQKMRHFGKFEFNINVEQRHLSKFMIPLSLQIVLENCFKHNKISSRKKLVINIISDENFLKVTNNYEPKTLNNIKGVGIKNIIGQYKLLSNKQPSFEVVDDLFYVELPYIESE